MEWCHQRGLRLRLKLNRADRSIATRLYRGMIATGMFVVPALICGLVLQQIAPLGLLLLVAVFGRGFQSSHLLRVWRQAKAGSLPLELPGLSFLFADSHAVLRYLVLSSAERFATHVVGISFWYLIGGLPFAVFYLVLAEIRPVYAVPVFGWAASSLFRLFHFIPALLATLFLTFGAWFTPRTKPLAVVPARSYLNAVSRLLHVSLGGTLPERELPWEGVGTPKLLPEHLARWLLLRLSASVLLVMALAAPKVVNLLILFVH